MNDSAVRDCGAAITLVWTGTTYCAPQGSPIQGGRSLRLGISPTYIDNGRQDCLASLTALFQAPFPARFFAVQVWPHFSSAPIASKIYHNDSSRQAPKARGLSQNSQRRRQRRAAQEEVLPATSPCESILGSSIDIPRKPGPHGLVSLLPCFRCTGYSTSHRRSRNQTPDQARHHSRYRLRLRRPPRRSLAPPSQRIDPRARDTRSSDRVCGRQNLRLTLSTCSYISRPVSEHILSPRQHHEIPPKFLHPRAALRHLPLFPGSAF